MAITVRDQRRGEARARTGVLEGPRQPAVKKARERKEPNSQSAYLADTGGISYFPIQTGLLDLPLVRLALPVAAGAMCALLLLGRLLWTRPRLGLVSAISLIAAALAFIDGLGTPSLCGHRTFLYYRQSRARIRDTARAEADERF
jgi:hypothetical protein